MGLLSGAKAAVLRQVHKFIDEQVTQQLTPFLEMGEGPDGEVCSDFVVDEHADMSLENMIVKTSVVNEKLVAAGVAFRIGMLRCKHVALDIPWGNLQRGKWKLELDGLMIVVTPCEKEEWSVDNVRPPPVYSHSARRLTMPR